MKTSKILTDDELFTILLPLLPLGLEIDPQLEEVARLELEALIGLRLGALRWPHKRPLPAKFFWN